MSMTEVAPGMGRHSGLQRVETMNAWCFFCCKKGANVNLRTECRTVLAAAARTLLLAHGAKVMYGQQTGFRKAR
jgi:hypothetical protein